MKSRFPFSLPVVLEIVFFIGVIIGIPFAIIQLQQQQDTRSRAQNEVFWNVSQSASTSCPSDGSGAVIKVTFKNSEAAKSSTAMDVKATDKQTGKSITMTNIQGGQTKNGEIKTGKSSLSAGTVEFALTWTDGHSGTDKRTANYNAISNCNTQATPTPKPISCPITPQGKIIINFPFKGIVATRSQSDAQLGPINTTIPAGTYKVTLASHDNHSSDNPPQVQPQESWFLRLRNSSESTIINTSAISDLPDTQDQKVEVVDEKLVVSQQAVSVLAIHAAYPGTNVNSIVPICAGLEPISPTPTPTKKPSSTPTIKPSSSPTPSKPPSVTPTICPTLGPVQNVRIDCPNCP
jgi:hypothetical protein